jgi:hypothetical protein
MSIDKTLNDLEKVLLKALNEKNLDPETLTKCKELLRDIIAKATTVKIKGGDREDIKKAVYDLLNKMAGASVAT